MIGRLGIPTSITGSGQPTGSSSSSSTSGGRSSITSTTSGMMSIGSSSLSGLSTGISKFSNMTKKVTETLVSSSGDAEKKPKDNRKAQIAMVVQMLEDISLQSPSSHLGLVLAYTGRNSSPVIHPGLKFTWFRMQGQDHIDQVEESQRAWYAPSVDDINCTICVQCEDNFGQGLSRYLECGPLQADPLLRSVTESSVSSGFFETKGVCVSIGLAEGESTNNSVAIDGSTVPVISPVDPHTLHTVLSKENSFLQLNGRCTVEIDEQGIFISIPTFHTPSRLSSRHGEDRSAFNTSRRGLRLPISTQMKVHCAAPSSLVLSVPIMQQQQAAGTAESAGNIDEEPLSPVPESEDGISSTASSPLKRSFSKDQDSQQMQSDVNQHSDDEAMKQFLTSSILAIPWTYEGHNLSPEAYISGLGSKLSPEEREKLLKEAEEDSMIFAQTVVALTEFIATVPEGTKELLLCFSCPDRLTRDTMVLSMRALACKASNTSRYERRRVLPWVQWEEGDGTTNSFEGTGHGSSHNLASMSMDTRGGTSSSTSNGVAVEASDYEWKRRLKAVEEEAAALKRERNELTKQLLETKEELSVTKSKYNKALKSPGGPASIAGDVHGSTGTEVNQSRPLTHRSTNSEGGDDGSMHAHSSNLSDTDATGKLQQNMDGNHGKVASDDVFAITDIRQLQQKLLELENKVSMFTKREQESLRQREELESQNTKLSSELDTTKRKKDDAREKLATLQKLYDQQGMLMRKLEQEVDNLREKVAMVNEKDRKISELDSELAAMRGELAHLEEEKRILKDNLEEVKGFSSQQSTQLTKMETEYAVKLQVLQSSIAHAEQQLASAMMENKRQEREILQHKETIERQKESLQRLKTLENQLQTAHQEIDKLQAEMNHLQKKSDSLSKDLKRIMKENAQSLSEFEKALIRKSGECDELYYQLLELREMEKARMQAAAAEDSAGTAILAKISSVLSNATQASSTHSNGSGGAGGSSNIYSTDASSGASGSNASGQISSRVTTMFRRMSASAASLAANVAGTGGASDDMSTSST